MAREIILEPIREDQNDYSLIEDEIRIIFEREIYLPLFRKIKSDRVGKVENEIDVLKSALKSGQIYFYRGKFKGKFNAAITKELKKLGAKWNRKQGSFDIPLGDLPLSLRTSISLSETNLRRKSEELDSLLGKILPEKIADKVNISKLFEKTIFRLDSDIRRSLKSISIQPKITKKQALDISKDYEKNMRLYIKDFTEREIRQLRKKIKKNTLQGVRYDSIISDIETSFQVSRNKAKFLARQETALMMGTYEESRYKAAGSDGYFWDCVAGSKAHPVRPYHKKLDGKFIRWDHPPVVNAKGDRKHAGKDYNCRCGKRVRVKF